MTFDLALKEMRAGNDIRLPEFKPGERMSADPQRCTWVAFKSDWVFRDDWEIYDEEKCKPAMWDLLLNEAYMYDGPVRRLFARIIEEIESLSARIDSPSGEEKGTVVLRNWKNRAFDAWRIFSEDEMEEYSVHLPPGLVKSVNDGTGLPTTGRDIRLAMALMYVVLNSSGE